MNQLTINNNELEIKEYNGERVVTFKDIDKVHNRPSGTARRNFNDNKSKFVENEDYFFLKPDVSPMYGFRTLNIPPKGLTLLTQTGYLMLVKSFTDDLAWKVQRELVNSYFNSKQPQPQQMSLPELYEYKPKYFRGMQVVSVADLSHFMGVSAFIIRDCLKRHKNSFIEGVDFWGLKGEDLASFKVNNKLCKTISSLLIFTESGFKKLNKLMGNAPVEVKCFEKPSKLLGMPKVKIVTDIPVNSAHQKRMAQLRKEITALDVLLLEMNKWISPKSAEAIKESALSIGASIYSDICRLSTEKYEEIEHPL